MFQRLAQTAVLIAAATLALGAQAAGNPTATLSSNKQTFVEYTGNGPVGNNNIQTNNKVFWMFESTGAYKGKNVDSWFVFFDPKATQTAAGTIRFSNDILYVFDDRKELRDTRSFDKPGVKYDYSDDQIGLESGDKNKTSFAGHDLSFSWNASNPGDHIRVFTAVAAPVPEPSTYALLGAGLLAVGFVSRRRQAH